MLWEDFKHLLINEITNSYSINSKIINILRKSYPLLKNNNSTLIEAAIINSMAFSDKWTVNDVSRENKQYGTQSDMVFCCQNNKFPISIKTNISKKSGLKILRSRVKVDEYIDGIKSEGPSFIRKIDELHTPILLIIYEQGKMNLYLKEYNCNTEHYDIKTKGNKLETLIVAGQNGRTLLTFSQKTGTIEARNDSFRETLLVSVECEYINTVVYQFIKTLQSGKDLPLEESF